MPTSSRIVSAFCSMIDEALLVEDLERGERPGQERLAGDVGVEARGAPGVATARAPRGCCRRSSVFLHDAQRPGDGARAGPRARPPPVGAGAVARAASRPSTRWVDGAVRWGKAIASTKCSWNRGSTAVSIFSTRRTTPSISRRAARAQQRDQRAGAGGVAGGRDAVQRRVRDQPEDHRVERVDLAAERAGEPDLVDRVDPGVVHQQPDAGVERGLGELDRPDVVLGDGDPEPAVASRRGGRS